MGDKRAKITVLMAVYNGSRFLRIAIESILSQTYQDFEFVIVDDASTDETLRIIRSYGDQRIKVIPLKLNVGQTEALNIGLKSSSAPWIARMDADDYSHPTRLQEQLEILELNPSIDCLGTYAWTFRNDYHEWDDEITTPCSDDEIKQALVRGSSLIHGTIVVRREALLEIGGYNGKYRYSADIEMYDRLLQNHYARTIPVALLGIRRHSGQGSRTVLALDENIEIFTKRLDSGHYTGKDVLIIRNSLSRFHTYRAIKYIQQSNCSMAVADGISAIKYCPINFFPNLMKIIITPMIPVKYLSHSVDIPGVTVFANDLSSYNESRDILNPICPDVIINAAALTDVDKCETDPDLAYTLNVEIPRNLASVATELNCRFVHISSDQLFDGSKAWFSEEDSPCPVNQYGYTKAKGEEEVLKFCIDALIIRTNFFGWGTEVRKSFSDWILNSLQKESELRLFSDVYFNPILINQLIDICLELLVTHQKGIFHVVGRERISKYEFGMRQAKEFRYHTTNIVESSIDEFSFTAVRPKEMTLNYRKIEDTLKCSMPNLSNGLVALQDLKAEYSKINIS